jgi:hypothetical protein
MGCFATLTEKNIYFVAYITKVTSLLALHRPSYQNSKRVPLEKEKKENSSRLPWILQGMDHSAASHLRNLNVTLNTGSISTVGSFESASQNSPAAMNTSKIGFIR